MYDFKLPKEYISLCYLHSYLGTIKTVEAVCHIWNKLNSDYVTLQLDNVRIKTIIDKGADAKIILTGVCSNIDEFLEIVNYLKTPMVQVTYEPTVISFEI